MLYTFKDRTEVAVSGGNYFRAVALKDNYSKVTVFMGNSLKVVVSMDNSKAAISINFYLFDEDTVTSIHFISLLATPVAITSQDIILKEWFSILVAFSFFESFLFLQVFSFSVKLEHFFAVLVSCNSFSSDLPLSC